MATPATRPHRSIPPAGDARYAETCDFENRTGTRRDWARRPGTWLSLALIGGAVALTAFFGSMFPADAWYRALVKPEGTPPDAVFPIAWTILYALMVVAAWLVWLRRGERRVTPAMTLFGVQLVLNGAWSWLFFGLHETGLALADLTALWLTVAAMMVMFWRHSRIASMITIPYLGWLTFAGWLNYQIWIMNP